MTDWSRHTDGGWVRITTCEMHLRWGLLGLSMNDFCKTKENNKKKMILNQ